MKTNHPHFFFTISLILSANHFSSQATDFNAQNKVSLIPVSNETGDKYGFKSQNNEIVIPPIYDAFSNLSKGRTAVEINSFWGFIDTSGKKVTPIKYQVVYDFYEDRACVSCDNIKFGCIDKSGKEVIPLKYDYIIDYSDRIAVVNIGDKFGFIDINGNEIIPLKYD